MDSKTINKLIRSEIWPILRGQGFSHFDSRNAFVYNGPFVNVVNFQSFNSYLAEGLECTTYSFTIRLGTYIPGSPGEDRLKRDKAGRLLPLEYNCLFRKALQKRTSVDGFKHDDIFYIHPNGSSTAPCFEEIRYLLRETALHWFEAHNDLNSLIFRMQRVEESISDPDLDAIGVPFSYNWNQVKSTLLLLKHRQEPFKQTADNALKSIDRYIGTVLDFSTIQNDRPGQEAHTSVFRELWEQLGSFRSIPRDDYESINLHGNLDSAIWSLRQKREKSEAGSFALVPLPSARKDLWPLLRKSGFTEFTERLAHRISDGFVEVVEFLPMDPAERKAQNYPPGLFRIGVGIFWTDLHEDRSLRINRDARPRPIANECHISNWLIPLQQTSGASPTVFSSIEEASAALSRDGLGWLEMVRDAERALFLLHCENWELFWRYPMMRGYGASTSSRRLTYMAFLSHRLHRFNEVGEYIARAEAALKHFLYEPERLKCKDWIYQVVARLDGSPARHGENRES